MSLWQWLLSLSLSAHQMRPHGVVVLHGGNLVHEEGPRGVEDVVQRVVQEVSDRARVQVAVAAQRKEKRRAMREGAEDRAKPHVEQRLDRPAQSRALVFKRANLRRHENVARVCRAHSNELLQRLQLADIDGKVGVCQMLKLGLQLLDNGDGLPLCSSGGRQKIREDVVAHVDNPLAAQAGQALKLQKAAFRVDAALFKVAHSVKGHPPCLRIQAPKRAALIKPQRLLGVGDDGVKVVHPVANGRGGLVAMHRLVQVEDVRHACVDKVKLGVGQEKDVLSSSAEAVEQLEGDDTVCVDVGVGRLDDLRVEDA
eukprot:m.129802 g.129802  ORF g.129802 m.129802 type:complete len:312 (-) comp16419_c0_seq2:1044-1979(-)